MTTLQLHHGDCLEKMKSIADKSVDLIICDLPYGCLSGRAIGKNAEKMRKKCRKLRKMRSKKFPDLEK